MALDPTDLLEPPYHFGETKVFDVSVTATCDCFKENVSTVVRVVKRGDWININMPNILAEAKTDSTTGIIEIPAFLNEECLGETPRVRYFSCICYAFDVQTRVPKACPGMITLEKDGKMTITPNMKTETNKDDFTTRSVTNCFTTDPNCSGNIGSLTFNISYVVNDRCLSHEVKTIKE